MKNRSLFSILILGLGILSCTQTEVQQQSAWKPAGDRLKTRWAEQVSPENALPEYPRPQMERKDWANLNGLWEYAITEKGEAEPEQFDGEILVPFAVESSLSGVQKTINEKQELWYKRTFSIPSSWNGKHVRLNFGAADWQTDVFVNDIFIGSHRGGYAPFSFDITPFMEKGSEQKLVVRVWDPTDKGFQPLGKQFQTPMGILYSSVTGIWQTVWIEPVDDNYVTAVKSIPDIDRSTVEVTIQTSGEQANDIVEAKLFDDGVFVSSARGLAGKALRLPVKKQKLWSPESPFLYGLEITLSRSGKVIDKVTSYTAMRKISSAKDANGIVRLQLNNRNILMFGILDQGYWPDGLYTAPTDEALLYDIKKTRDFGFNMIRKHAKTEPARWYYHCDKEGMLVWQDMPGGEIGGNAFSAKEYNGGTDKIRTKESRDNFFHEWTEVMNLCVSNPSVVVWIPFNEGWGQFETDKVVEFTKSIDPSRLVDPSSGGNHRPTGDMLDLHNYPEPLMFLYDSIRVTAMGEYGGIGWAVKGHCWVEGCFGAIWVENSDEATKQYIKYTNDIQQFVGKGMSAAVYTQLTDVESEANGLLTYDRAELKMDEAKVREANQSVINELNKK